MLGAEMAVLALTGIALYFIYRPAGTAAWNESRVDHGSRAISGLMRSAHWYTAHLALATALVASVVTAMGGVGRRWTARVLGVVLVLAAGAAWYTGFLLPWNQLALWATTGGNNISGYAAIFQSKTRFVLIGGHEVLPSAVIRWLLFHAVVGGPVMAVLIAFAWKRRAARPMGEIAEPRPSGAACRSDPENAPPVRAW